MGGYGIALDGSSSVYFADAEAKRIRKIDSDSDIISTYLGETAVDSVVFASRAEGAKASAPLPSRIIPSAAPPPGNGLLAGSQNSSVRSARPGNPAAILATVAENVLRIENISLKILFPDVPQPDIVQPESAQP